MRIGMIGPQTGGAGGVLTNLSAGFDSMGHETVQLRSAVSTLRAHPFRKPGLTLSAFVDNYLLKAPDWPSLVSLSRDKVSQIKTRDLEDLDLIVIRWNNGVLMPGEIPSGLPMIWGLPDQNTFTGVCHYSGDCSRFATGCQNCPALRPLASSLAAANLQRKIESYGNFERLHFVAPSQWMLKKAESSQLSNFSISHIPNPIHSDFLHRETSGKKLQAKLNIGFAATNVLDPLKGFRDILPVLNTLSSQNSIQIHVAGHLAKTAGLNTDNFNLWGHQDSRDDFICFLDELDYLVVPSKQEAAGMVALEAMARGVLPIVSKNGGLSEQLGPIANHLAISDFAAVPNLIEQLAPMYPKLSEKARSIAGLHSPEKIAKKYLEAKP